MDSPVNPAASVLDVFRNATAGTTWRSVNGALVIEGMDLDAEVTLRALGGGSGMLLDLVAEVEKALDELGPGVPDGDLLAAMQTAAEIVASRDAVLPADPHPLTLWLVARAPRAPLAAAVAEHPATPPAVLVRLAHQWRDSHRETGRLQHRTVEGLAVLVAVASNRQTPPKVLSDLSMVDHAQVRLAAARNPSTPHERLRRLALGPRREPSREAAQQTLALLDRQRRAAVSG